MVKVQVCGNNREMRLHTECEWPKSEGTWSVRQQLEGRVEGVCHLRVKCGGLLSDVMMLLNHHGTLGEPFTERPGLKGPSGAPPGLG